MNDGNNENQTNGTGATSLGRYIREARERRGLSGGQLARALKMHHSYVSRLENDAFRSPSPEKLRKVAEVLDLNQGDVFALAGYHRPADLPSFAPYLRAKYQMSDEDMERITDYFSLLQEKHGIVDRPPRELAVHEPEVDRTTVSWQDL